MNAIKIGEGRGSWRIRDGALAAGLFAGMGVGLGSMGCASAPPTPPEFTDALAHYESAASDPSVRAHAPVELLAAGRVLDRAEAAREDEDDVDEVRHLARLAAVRVEIAEATAASEMTGAERERIEGDLEQLLEQAERAGRNGVDRRRASEAAASDGRAGDGRAGSSDGSGGEGAWGDRRTATRNARSGSDAASGSDPITRATRTLLELLSARDVADREASDRAWRHARRDVWRDGGPTDSLDSGAGGQGPARAGLDAQSALVARIESRTRALRATEREAEEARRRLEALRDELDRSGESMRSVDREFDQRVRAIEALERDLTTRARAIEQANRETERQLRTLDRLRDAWASAPSSAEPVGASGRRIEDSVPRSAGGSASAQPSSSSGSSGSSDMTDRAGSATGDARARDASAEIEPIVEETRASEARVRSLRSDRSRTERRIADVRAQTARLAGASTETTETERPSARSDASTTAATTRTTAATPRSDAIRAAPTSTDRAAPTSTDRSPSETHTEARRGDASGQGAGEAEDDDAVDGSSEPSRWQRTFDRILGRDRAES
ncbi:MAG: DUF4398 domain-containing protein [Myxococcota bacterium]